MHFACILHSAPLFEDSDELCVTQAFIDNDTATPVPLLHAEQLLQTHLHLLREYLAAATAAVQALFDKVKTVKAKYVAAHVAAVPGLHSKAPALATAEFKMNPGKVKNIAVLEGNANSAQEKFSNVKTYISNAGFDSVLSRLLRVGSVSLAIIDTRRDLPVQFVIAWLALAKTGCKGFDYLIGTAYISKSAGDVQDEIINDILKTLRSLPDGCEIPHNLALVLDGEHTSWLHAQQQQATTWVGDLVHGADAAVVASVKTTLRRLDRVQESCRPTPRSIPDDNLLAARSCLELTQVQPARKCVKARLTIESLGSLAPIQSGLLTERNP